MHKGCIEVNKNALRDTVYHEIGHGIHRRIYKSALYPPPKDFKQLFDKIFASEGFKRLLSNRGNYPYDYNKYQNRNREIFARAYQQYCALKDYGDSWLKKTGMEHYIRTGIFWELKDFKNIQKEFDKFIKGLKDENKFNL